MNLGTAEKGREPLGHRRRFLGRKVALSFLLFVGSDGSAWVAPKPGSRLINKFCINIIKGCTELYNGSKRKAVFNLSVFLKHTT